MIDAMQEDVKLSRAQRAFGLIGCFLMSGAISLGMMEALWDTAGRAWTRWFLFTFLIGFSMCVGTLRKLFRVVRRMEYRIAELEEAAAGSGSN